MRIALVGLGLIGGSFAKAIKSYTSHTVGGYDISSAVQKTAQHEGTIDHIATDYSTYDLVLLSLYPHDTIAFLQKHAATFRSGAVVMDCCGIKEFICTQAEPLFANSQARFIGGHPMAGREFSGYSYALSNLFEGASMILTPPDDTPLELLDTMTTFFKQLGFGQVTITTPKQHDQVIAYTSQLAHVVSNAYMQSPTAQEYAGFSAGSFADLTRVAKLNATMWTELFLCNQAALLSEIDTLVESLAHYRTAIATNNAKELHRILEQGSNIKIALTE